MAFRLHRLDAVHTATFAPVGLSLIGGVPDAIKLLYQTFTERYPTIGLESFRALNANTLAELGLGVLLMGGRLDITVTMAQLAGRATNLQTPTEVTFAQDCALLAHSVAKKVFSNSAIAGSNLRISTWIKVLEESSFSAEALLQKLATPSNSVQFDKAQIRAQRMLYTPRLDFTNDADGWRLQVGVEKSAIPEADIFLLRDYQFAPTTTVGSLEQQFAFVDTSTLAILEWLGIGELKA